MVVYFKSWRSRVHPQDGVWSWLVCFCASLEAAIVIGLAMSFGALLPSLMKHFNSGRERTGIKMVICNRVLQQYAFCFYKNVKFLF